MDMFANQNLTGISSPPFVKLQVAIRSVRVLQVVEFEAALTKILECVPAMIVVITSRETPQFLKLVPNIHLVRMTGLSAKDAHELLCLLSPGITPVAAELLAAECGHIPYAISLIGKSMFLNGISAEVGTQFF